MKKGLIGVLALTFFIILAFIPDNDIKAYEFSVCYHCDGTGQYHCDQCNDRGISYCAICAGKGGWECPYCDGKGYDTCPGCKGDTYTHLPDGTRDIYAEPGSCGVCNGTGKRPCGKCGESGWYNCFACGGAGYGLCQSECRNRDKDDKLCSYCKGTGFLGDGFNFKDEWNDGKTNIPKEGNTIWRSDRTSYKYHKNPTGADAKKIADELAANKKKYIADLEKALNIYSEDLYTEKQLKKLKSTYDKAVKVINKAADLGDIKTAYFKYIGLMTDIRPAVLEKYKEKCKKKLRKANADLEKSYSNEDGYWDRKFEQIMGDGVEAISKTKTKSKAKKIMNSTLKKMVY